MEPQITVWKNGEYTHVQVNDGFLRNMIARELGLKGDVSEDLKIEIVMSHDNELKANEDYFRIKMK